MIFFLIALGVLGFVAFAIAIAIGAWGHKQDLRFFVDNGQIMVSHKSYREGASC